MPIRLRGFRMSLSARLATLLILVVAALSLTAGSASAVTCPGSVASGSPITRWVNVWPNAPGVDSKGVALCQGQGFPSTKGWLQIVDLAAGAQVRLWSHLDPNGPEPGYDVPNTSYQKRTAEGWYNFLRGSAPTSPWQTPRSDRLFSTTNASFFKDTDNSHPTQLPLPYWGENADESIWFDDADTMGVAQGNYNDPDFTAPKRGMAIQAPNWLGATRQAVRIDYFPNYYQPWDDPVSGPGYHEYLQHVGGNENEYDTLEAAVGFAPGYALSGNPSDTGRRTYYGKYEDRLYILTTEASYTVAQADSILQSIKPGMSTIQMDGGGSTQFYSSVGPHQDSVVIPDREVPNVLAIYRAP